VHQIFSFSLRAYFSIVLFALFITVSNSGFSQRLGFGPKLGVNASVFRGDFPEKGMRQPKIGFSAGGYLLVKGKKNKNWQFEADVLYTTRGHKANFYNTITLDPNAPYPVEKDKYTYNIGYLEIPLLFRYMLNRGGVIRPYLLFGPVYSGLLNAKFTGQTLLKNKKGDDVIDYLNRDDLGLMVGWGIQNFILDRWYHLDIRLYHGFINNSQYIQNDLYPCYSCIQSLRSSEVISKYRNSSVTITIGVGLETSETFFLR
jgi:hypothetical protein